MQDYVNEWLFTAAYIGNTSIGTAVDKRVEPLFQGGVFEAPRGNLNSPTSWNVKNALLDGIDSTGRVKTMSDHDVRNHQFLFRHKDADKKQVYGLSLPRNYANRYDSRQSAQSFSYDVLDVVSLLSSKLFSFCRSAVRDRRDKLDLGKSNALKTNHIHEQRETNITSIVSRPSRCL